MANQINLSDAQIDRLNEITSFGQTNFVKGYEYISELMEGNPNVNSIQSSSLQEPDRSTVISLQMPISTFAV